MDPVSQGVVGAVVAGSMSAKKETLRLAALAGWLGGIAADADVLIRSKADPLLVIEYHRHFSHSLVFIPVGGAIVAGVLWVLLGGKEAFGRLFAFATAGFATAGLLDACTSYGTQLLWPFSDARVAWNVISIVDPVFTVPLLVFLLVGTFRRQVGWVRGALIFCLSYLGLGTFQNHRATEAQASLAEARGHAADMSMATVKPSIGNLVLWRSLYRHEGEFYVDAVRVGGPGSARIYPGTSVPALDAASLKRDLPADSVLAHDIDRFEQFSGRYLARHPEQHEVVGDVRYALLPNEAVPLWGIRYDPDRPERHVGFESFRVADEARRSALFRMILGKDPN